VPLAEPTPVRVGPDDVDEVRAFLSACDLTVAGLADPGVRLWAVRGATGAVVGTTGYETGPDGRHALLRSVAVGPALRGSGRGAALARFAMAEVAAGRARPVRPLGRSKAAPTIRARGGRTLWA